jgi:lipopolysaccharide export system permease protein
MVSDVEDTLYNFLRRDGCIKHPKIKYEIHVNSIQGRTLRDVIFKRRAADGKSFDVVVRAREAELHVDMVGQQILIDMYQGQVMQRNTVGILEHNIWPVEIPSELTSCATKERAMDMTFAELSEYEEKWRQEKRDVSQKIDLHQKQIDLGRGEAHFAKHVRDLVNERKRCDSQIFNIDSEWHMRPALAFGCLCFALVGCPIGIWFSKSDYLSAFITCFLPIVTLYYPLMFCAINMARAGKFPPWLGVYHADILMLIAGLILFRRLARS